MAVNGFLVNDEVQKYNYESLENYNTPDFSSSSTYQVGDYVMYQGKLYKCITEITTSGGWDSSKWSLAILSDDVANLRSSVESGEYGLSEPVKQALLQIARKIAYIDDQGQTYYDDLYYALYPLHVVSISTVYTQSGTVYDTDTLDSLKTDLVVTAVYSDSSTQTVPAADYTLSGTLDVGTSVITVSYGGKTDTFSVTVTEKTYTSLYALPAATVFDGSNYVDTNLKLLQTDIDYTITVNYTNGANAIPSGLSGSPYLLHIIHEVSPYYGLSFFIGLQGKYGLGGPVTPIPYPDIPYTKGAAIKIVIRHYANTDFYTLDATVNGTRITGVSFTATKTVTSISETLKIGAKRNNNGTYTGYWKGTVNELHVYNEAIADVSVDRYLS